MSYPKARGIRFSIKEIGMVDLGLQKRQDYGKHSIVILYIRGGEHLAHELYKTR